MGDESVILEGLPGTEAERGAPLDCARRRPGNEPRRRPAGRVRRGKVVKQGLVDWPAVQRRLREQGIVLVGGGADEAPEVYKRLPEVLGRARRLGAA